MSLSPGKINSMIREYKQYVSNLTTEMLQLEDRLNYVRSELRYYEGELVGLDELKREQERIKSRSRSKSYDPNRALSGVTFGGKKKNKKK